MICEWTKRYNITGTVASMPERKGINVKSIVHEVYYQAEDSIYFNKKQSQGKTYKTMFEEGKADEEEQIVSEGDADVEGECESRIGILTQSGSPRLVEILPLFHPYVKH